MKHLFLISLSIFLSASGFARGPIKLDEYCMGISGVDFEQDELKNITVLAKESSNQSYDYVIKIPTRDPIVRVVNRDANHQSLPQDYVLPKMLDLDHLTGKIKETNKHITFRLIAPLWEGKENSKLESSEIFWYSISNNPYTKTSGLLSNPPKGAITTTFGDVAEVLSAKENTDTPIFVDLNNGKNSVNFILKACHILNRQRPKWGPEYYSELPEGEDNPEVVIY